MLAIYLSRQLTNLTLEEIGKEFGVGAPLAGQAAAVIGGSSDRGLRKRLAAITEALGEWAYHIIMT